MGGTLGRLRRIGIACSPGTSLTAFFAEVLAEAEGAGLVSDEHFTVDGTLLEAWASQKSFRRRNTPPDTPDDPGIRP